NPIYDIREISHSYAIGALKRLYLFVRWEE
ncbi:unnamed protein product, partial [marine sediment metagenome]